MAVQEEIDVAARAVRVLILDGYAYVGFVFGKRVSKCPINFEGYITEDSVYCI